MELITISRSVRHDLVRQGFAWIPQDVWWLGPRLEPFWQNLCEDWDHLELDEYLADGATFRRRRYGRFYWSPADQELLPLLHEPYFQPEEENGYAGGIAREFAPLLPETMRNPFLQALAASTFACLPVAGDRLARSWEVRIHQIRIVATPEQAGLPAPEGVHQDGTDFLTLHLVRRQNIAGGETTIYDLEGNPIQRLTLRDSLDSMILDDPRIMHGVTPVTPGDGQSLGTRDMLGLDFIYNPDIQRPD
jgi:hypothetical protein